MNNGSPEVTTSTLESPSYALVEQDGANERVVLILETRREAEAIARDVLEFGLRLAVKEYRSRPRRN